MLLLLVLIVVIEGKRSNPNINNHTCLRLCECLNEEIGKALKYDKLNILIEEQTESEATAQ